MSWLDLRLSDVVHINPRRQLPGHVTDDSEVSFVPMAAVSEQTASIVEGIRRPLHEVARGYTPFRDGDVIFAKITPCMENGKLALAENLANGVGFGSTEFHVLRPSCCVDARFLYYFLRQPWIRTQGKRRLRGAVGQQRLPEEFLKSLPFGLPSPTEQRRMVEILDAADALRRQRAETNAKVQRILPALFYKMFGDPACWERTGQIVPLGQLVDAQGGGTPSKQNADYWNGTIPWVSPKDMKRDFIGDAEDHLTELAIEETTSRLISTSSILIVVRGMILARDVPIALTEREVTINQDMKALAVTDARVSPLYLFASLKALKPRLLAAIGTAAHGTRKLDTDRLLAMPILMPDPAKHVQFVRWFQDARRIVDGATDSGPKINRLFDVLLHRAFTGELTAKWREKHKQQLEAEMLEQQKTLEQAATTQTEGRRRSGRNRDAGGVTS